MPEMIPKQLTPEGATIMTKSGILLNLEHPKAEQINMTDISHGLAFTCRYGAQSRQFCSVAQHSVHVYEYVRHHCPKDKLLQKWALLHDAAEAYLSDMPTPLKKILPEYQKLEKKMLRAIMIRFRIHVDEPLIVKQGDAAALHWEWPENMPHHPEIEPRQSEAPFHPKRWQAKTSSQALEQFRGVAESLGLYDV